MTRHFNPSLCLLAITTIGYIRANEGVPKFQFELSKEEISALNAVIDQSNTGDSIQSITERLSNTRQPIGSGGREVRTYDEMDSRKVFSLSIVVYVKRQMIDPSVGRSIFVNFWFKHGALTDVSTNSLEIKIKQGLLDQSTAALKRDP